MPRTARASLGGVVYHILNRGNGRTKVFHNDEDYAAFLELIAAACERLPMRVLAGCLLPNQFQLILWPRRDGDLSRWMQWLLTSHVRRHHRRHPKLGGGHVWQGRFKAFPIEPNEHLHTVLRYVERTPLRAKLVAKSQDWPWGTLSLRRAKAPPSWQSDWPDQTPIPRDWTRLVNRPETKDDLAAIQTSLTRGRPFGGEAWTRRTAKRLGLESTLNPRGRPKATAEK